MKAEQVIQGRRLTPADIGVVRHCLATNPGWNRTRLSRELCERWNWRNGVGRLKDMSCRLLLLRLESRGEIRLPVRQTPDPNARRNRRVLEVPCDRTPVAGPLSALCPLRMDLLGEGHRDASLFRFLLQRYHDLGLRNVAGENLKYLVRDRDGRPLACLLFNAAAWKVQARDGWIGWSATQRQQRLEQIANHARFLVLPWVRVPHLASHVLGLVAQRLDSDWRAKYGHGILVLETFVERDRFRGTCYRAAGWLHVGATVGRSRNDRDQTLRVPVKDIYLRPLQADFRRRLCV